MTDIMSKDSVTDNKNTSLVYSKSMNKIVRKKELVKITSENLVNYLLFFAY